MGKPNLEDYGLNSSIVTEIKKRTMHNDQINKREENSNSIFRKILGVIITFFVITSIYLFGKSRAGQMHIDADWVFILFLFAGILWFIFLMIRRHTIRSYYLSINQDELNRYNKFNKDLHEYERESNRTKENYWRNLSGVQFEKEVGHLFDLEGYTVNYTPGSGDKGIDLILMNDHQKIAVQCKCWQKPVGEDSLRNFLGAMFDQKYNKGFFVSLSGFSHNAKEFTKKHNISTFTIYDLINIQRKQSKID
jgi:hypothetical protein